MFSCKFCEVFNNAFLTKHLRPTPLTPKSRPTPPTPPTTPPTHATHATHAPTLPTPPTLFSRLFKEGLIACNLITFYDKKTEHRDLKRKQKEIYQMTLLGQVIFEQGTAWKQITNHIIFAKDNHWGVRKSTVSGLIARLGVRKTQNLALSREVKKTPSQMGLAYTNYFSFKFSLSSKCYRE